MTLAELQPFVGEEHQPFTWPGQRGTVICVHGFPGTPAEMHGVAKVLHADGWEVQGLLLPGFGAEIARLDQFQAQDWIDHVAQRVTATRRPGHAQILLGYSLGGALAISAAAQVAVDGLILISPFWRLGGFWPNHFWPLLRLFFHSFKPFKDVDFSKPEARQNIHNVLPGIDLDDPEIQAELRSFTIPRHILDQVRAAGKLAYHNAAHLTGTGIVVQGNTDETVPSVYTQRLARRLGASFHYREITADHQYIRPDNAGFTLLSQQILGYVQQIETQI